MVEEEEDGESHGSAAEPLLRVQVRRSPGGSHPRLRSEWFQFAPALLQPGRGHADHSYGHLRGGCKRAADRGSILQTGRRTGIW